MKPHRRKPTPPRRDDAESQTSGEAHEENAAPEEPHYAPDETISYDPGAALMDEHQAYVDPNQAYVEPTAEYEGAEHEYLDPNQQVDYPEPSHTSGGIYDDAPEFTPQAPPPPRLVKKKVTKRAPQRRPHVPARKAPGAGHKRPRPTYSSDGGSSIMTVFLTLVALGMLAVVTYVVLPRDMTTVAGYPVNPLTSPKPRNLLEEAQQAMITRTTALTFTEEEVNQYLNHRLQAEQTGPMAALVEFRGVYVDFTPGLADVIIERELFGMPLTMGVTISTDRFRQQTVYRATNWHLGRIDLEKRNIKPVIDLFLRLRMSCLDEFQALQQMADVKFEENQVILDATL